MRSREVDRDALLNDERLEQGYVIILPGIEGHSRWNRGIRKGLVDAGVPYAIEIHDWTLGPRWYIWNLRDSRRHRAQADTIAGKIAGYRQTHPTQPVYLIGHSGGGAMTAFTLAALPKGVKATGGIMMVGALSPHFDLTPALANTHRGLWNYSSAGDLFFVGIGTMLCGTCDGRYTPGSGLLGFRGHAARHKHPSESPPLHQMWFNRKMLRDFNLGGHLSCVNPRFIRNWIAPILLHDHADAAMSTIPAALESTSHHAATVETWVADRIVRPSEVQPS